MKKELFKEIPKLDEIKDEKIAKLTNKKCNNKKIFINFLVFS